MRRHQQLKREATMKVKNENPSEHHPVIVKEGPKGLFEKRNEE